MARSSDSGVVESEATLDRLEGEMAILLIEGGEIALPKKLLPKGSKEGDVMYVTISTDKKKREEREKKARDLLNEILGWEE